MARSALSNRDRKQLRKSLAKPPQHVRGSAEVRVAAVKPPKAPDIRDGLEWLRGKGRLTLAQFNEGKAYRAGFRDAGDVSILTTKLGDVVSGGQQAGLPGAAVASMTTARRLMFVARFVVLRGHVDMLTVMDGVCGLGHTVSYLAGGDHHRAKELEITLKLALDLLVAFRAGPPALSEEMARAAIDARVA